MTVIGLPCSICLVNKGTTEPDEPTTEPDEPTTEDSEESVEEELTFFEKIIEDKDIDADRGKKREYRTRFIHYDIRPFRGLKTDNRGRKANEYDEVIVRSLPLILKS